MRPLASEILAVVLVWLLLLVMPVEIVKATPCETTPP
jgi:hypothetical protein